jgi:hypothetical protein
MLDPFMTAQKLEEVKNIIEKPEERWRVLWHQPRLAESPPSPCGSSRSFNSSIGSWNNRTSIQVRKNFVTFTYIDILKSAVKVHVNIKKSAPNKK